MSPKVLGRFLALCSFAICGTKAFAQNAIHVPTDSPTIQGAINAAVSGDTVWVAPGTYVENVDFKGKNITVISEQGATTTIIDGNNLAAAVSFHTSENGGAVLNGFTIRHGNGSGNGGGVLISASSPKILNNVIDSNTACGGGGGIGISSGSPLIQGNTISNNSQFGCSGGTGGGGIGLLSGAGTQIIGNTITNNSWSSGGGIAMNGSGAVTVRNNQISSNTASNQGGGMYMVNESDEDVVQNQIANNIASSGGGIYLSVPSGNSRGVALVNNTFAGNIATGSAVYISGFYFQTRIVNNIFVARPSLTAFYCDNTFSSTAPTYKNNDAYSSGGSAYGASCASFTGTNGNISADPQFINSGLLNFHLLLGSPAIDAGNNSDSAVPATDYDGATRIIDGNNDSVATIDMGSFEYAATSAQALPDPLTFADQLVLTPSAPQSVTLTNTGASALQVNSISAPTDFVLTNTCIPAAGIVPGATCTISVTFQPTLRGQRDASLSISANLATPLTISLVGKGIGPVPQFQPSTLGFGAQVFGGSSVAQTSSLINNGDAPLAISNIQATGDFQQTNNCPVSLATAASCTFSVVFTPAQHGGRTGSIAVSDNAVGSPHSLALSGTGVSPSARLSTTSLTFGSQPYGATSSSQQVTLTNNGDSPLSIGTIAITPDYAQTNDCPATLNVAAVCHLNIAFSPLARGARPGNVSITDDAPASPQIVSLSGTGLAPVAQLSLVSLQFGNQLVGRASPNVSVSISNVGDAPMLLNYLAHGDFNLAGSCPATLNVNANCSASLSFDPTTTGPRSGDVTFSYNGPATPAVIPLSGTGVLFGFDQTLVTFTPQVLHESSQPATIALVNIGNEPVNISSIAASADFQQSNSCPAMLPSNGSCSVSVTFVPTALGNRFGTVMALGDAGTQTATMVGTGVMPQIGLSPASVAFGNQLIGQTGSASRVTVSNSGTGRLTITNIFVPAPFTQTNTCSSPIAVGSTCFIDVTVTATETGALTAALLITDDSTASPQSVTLTAMGVTSLSQATINSFSPLGGPVGGNPITLTVNGTNFSASSIVRWNTTDLATQFVSSSQLQAAVTAAQLSTSHSVDITVYTGSPGGTTSNSMPFALYQSVAVAAKDILYEPVSGKILATTPSLTISNPNSLVLIDPQSASVTNSIFVGNEPGKLALSDTGHTAYVAQDGNGNITKVDLIGGMTTLEFSLGFDSSYGSRYVEDMAVVPGSESALAVARKYLNVSPRHAGIAIYDDGMKRTNETGRYNETNTIVFAGRSDVLYGYDSEVSDFSFRRMAIDASGITITDSTQNLISYYNVFLRSDGSHIFSTVGSVIDPAVPSLLGSYSLTGVPSRADVVPLQDVNRTLFLNTSPARIDVYDSGTFANLASISLPIAVGTASRLIRWGIDGMAVRVTDNNSVDHIVLLHSSLLTSGSSAAISVSAASPASLSTGAAGATVTLSGHGFSAGMRARFNGQERSGHFISATQMEVSLTADDLAAPGLGSLDLLSPAGAPVAGVVITVIGPNSAFSANAVDFGAQIINNSSRAASVTLTNLAAVPLSLQSISATGDFMESNNCSSVPGNGSCTISVTFTPRVMGARTGMLTADLGHSPIAIPLSGSAFDIVLSIPRGSRTSRSATTPSTSQVEVAVALHAVSPAAVSYDCSGAPAGTVCVLTPNPNGDGQGSVTVSLKSIGRLRRTPASANVTLNARVGNFTRSLPLQLTVDQPPAKRSLRLR